VKYSEIIGWFPSDLVLGAFVMLCFIVVGALGVMVVVFFGEFVGNDVIVRLVRGVVVHVVQVIFVCLVIVLLFFVVGNLIFF
jgi:hypothetical protein